MGGVERPSPSARSAPAASCPGAGASFSSPKSSVDLTQTDFRLHQVAIEPGKQAIAVDFEAACHRARASSNRPSMAAITARSF